MRRFLNHALFTLVSLTALFPPVSHAAPDPVQIARVIRSDISDAAVVAAFRDMGVTAADAAEALENYRPLAPAPFVGVKRVDLKGPDGRMTDLHVIVPRAYKGKRKWPLAVLLHGRGGSGAEIAEYGGPIADAFGFIVLAPSAKRFKGCLPVHPHWWKYDADNFALAAVNWAKDRFLIDDDRVLLMGYSMGGFGAWNIGLRHPDRFCAMAPIAGGISQGEYTGGTDHFRRALLGNAAWLNVFFAHGNRDKLVPVSFDRRTHGSLTRMGIPHTYREVDKGTHFLEGFLAVKDGSIEDATLLRELFDLYGGKARSPAASRADVRFTAIETPARAGHVRIDRARDFPCSVRVRAKPGTVILEVENVRSLTLFGRGGGLIEPGKRLKVLHGGDILYDGVPEPSLQTIVRSWRRLRDRKRVFSVAIHVEISEDGEEGF